MPFADEKSKLIRVGHSPDPDDAFMFYALAKDKIDTGTYRFQHELQDIETLNQRALKGELELTAISYHAYAYLHDRYFLLPHGGSIGEGYGPLLCSSSKMDLNDLKGKTVAIPGKWTTAALVLRLFHPEIETVCAAFDQIGDAVKAGQTEDGIEISAGVIIHEGQLTYEKDGLYPMEDLGVRWQEDTGLPLPLGGNALRKDLSSEDCQEVSRLLLASIQYGLQHREAALEYALSFGRGLSMRDADRFVQMYVNERTEDIGEDGRRAAKLLLKRAFQANLIPAPPADEDFFFDRPLISE